MPSGRRLHVEPMPRGCHLRYQSHQRLLYVLVCQWLQGYGLQRGHRRVRAGFSVRARRSVCQHPRLLRLQLHAGLHRATLRDQRQRV